MSKNNILNSSFTKYEDIKERLNEATEKYLDMTFKLAIEKELNKQIEQLERRIKKTSEKSNKKLEEKIEEIEKELSKLENEANKELDKILETYSREKSGEELEKEQLKIKANKQKLEIVSREKEQLKQLKQKTNELRNEQAKQEKVLRIFYTERAKSNNDMSGNNFHNRYLVNPKENIREAIENAYIQDTTLTGIIGTGEIEKQDEVIKQIALEMVVENQLAHNEKGKEQQKHFKNKDRAIEELIAALYIRENTCEEKQKNKYSYGVNEDKDEKTDVFCIDLPNVGQIGVHFGSGSKKSAIIRNAKRKANSILEKKCELGEIETEKLEELKKDIEDNILPDYTGYYFERLSKMPIPYDKKINKEKVEQYAKKEIINLREFYTLTILGDWGKEELQSIANMTKDMIENRKCKNVSKAEKKVNVTTMGRSCINKTNAEERRRVYRHEKHRQEINKNSHIKSNR